MRKQYKIRWSRQDKKDLTNAVRKFNAKITREIKRNPDIAMFLPERITTEGLRSRIKTRQDLNRELNSINRFGRKDATKPVMTPLGLMTTRWEKNEIGIRVASINRRRSRTLKEADLKPEKGNTYVAENANLLPKKYNINKIKPSDWDKYKKGVFKQTISTYTAQGWENYKRSYLLSIEENLYQSENAKALKKLIESLDAETVYKGSFYSPNLDIVFTYDPKEQDWIVQRALETWEEYLNEVQR